MYCKARPPDVAPVVLRFNYEADNALTYQISTQSGNTYVSTAATLLLAVTLTLDCLSLSVCSVLSVMQSNNVPKAKSNN